MAQTDHHPVQELSSETLERVLGLLPDGVLVAEATGRLRYANAAALQLLGLPASDALPPTLEQLAARVRFRDADGHDLPGWRWPTTTAAGTPAAESAATLVGADRVERPVRCTGGLLPLDDGQPGCWLRISNTSGEARAMHALGEERDLTVALVDQSPLGKLVVRAPEMVVELANRVAAELRPGLDMAGRTIAEIWPDAVGSGYLGLLAKVARTGEAVTLEDAPVDFLGAERRHFWMRLSRLPQAPGSPLHLLVIIRETTGEVSARARAEVLAAQRTRDLSRARLTSARLKSLVDLAGVMARTPGLEDLLRLVTVKAAKLLRADSASLFLLERNELVGRATHGLPSQEMIGLRLDLAVWREVAEMLRTGRPIVHVRAEEVRGPEVPFIRRFGIRSYMAVLLGTPVRPLGVLFVNHTRALHRFTRPELAFVETLTTYLTVAIERRQLVEGLREAVASLQAALLPTSFPDVPGLEIAARYCSASEVAQVGGDFYDIVPLPDGRVAAVIGDICGKGVAAARHTARLRYDLRSVLEEQTEPGAALSAFNDRVVDEFQEDEYVTLLLAFLDPRSGRMEWASAGHPPPSIAAAPTAPAEGGLPAGLFPSEQYRTTRTQVPGGTAMILHTDGVVDARSPEGVEFGPDRLASSVQDAAADADTVANELLEAVTRHAGGQLDDDAAVLVLRRVPAARRPQP
jgi:serine phosphatase RsbU (regulator of sigma subunit)